MVDKQMRVAKKDRRMDMAQGFSLYRYV